MIKISSIFATLIFILSLTLLFFCPEISRVAINSALNLSASSVIPSLFPCFVLTNLWILTGNAQSFSQKVGGIYTKLFHLPPMSAYAFFIGCLSGFPAGAQALFQLYDEKLISKEDTEQALLFCSNASPGFVIGFIGNCLFQSSIIGLALWIIHIFSALILGFIFRPSPTWHPTTSSCLPENKLTFFQSLPKAITQAGETTFRVSAMIMFFTLITTFFSTTISAALKTQPLFILAFGAIELVNSAPLLTNFPQVTAFILCSALISWNGLCVHCQVLSSVQTPLSFKKYFFGKLCHAILSTIIALMISNVLPLTSTCASVNTSIEFNPITLLPFATLLLLYTKTSSGKSSTVRI